jgi:hypothetical protein
MRDERSRPTQRLAARERTKTRTMIRCAPAQPAAASCERRGRQRLQPDQGSTVAAPDGLPKRVRAR